MSWCRVHQHCILCITTGQDQQMMLLVQQQQILLNKQKSAHEASQRQGRVLQDQRRQLEGALRQNSQLQSQNKVGWWAVRGRRGMSASAPCSFMPLQFFMLWSNDCHYFYGKLSVCQLWDLNCLLTRPALSSQWGVCYLIQDSASASGQCLLSCGRRGGTYPVVCNEVWVSVGYILISGEPSNKSIAFVYQLIHLLPGQPKYSRPATATEEAADSSGGGNSQPAELNLGAG